MKINKTNTYWSQVILLMLFMVFVYPVALVGIVLTGGDILSLNGFMRDLAKPDMGSVLIRVLTWLILPVPILWGAAIAYFWPKGSRRTDGE